MSRQNIRVKAPNFTTDGEYFYCFLQESQTMQAKTDDGNIAFSYPIDTTVDGTITSLEWDGVYFWTIEEHGSGATAGFKIRKWAIHAYVVKQLSVFTFSSDTTHTYDADDFAVEHYRVTLRDNSNGAGGYTMGIQDINVSDTAKMAPGDILTFVRAGTPAMSRYATTFVQTAVVQSVLSSTKVRLTAAIVADPYGDGLGYRGPGASYNTNTEHPPPDLVYVTKALWVFNENAPGDTSTSALYKINAYNGSNIVQYVGTQYGGITAATFYTKYNTSIKDVNKIYSTYNTTIVNDPVRGGLQTYILFVTTTSLLFYNVTTGVIDRGMTINNLKANATSWWQVFDLCVGGYEPDVTLYRLQGGTTFGVPLTDQTWTPQAYSYERSILRRYVHSITVVASPAIIPADNASTSIIMATVRDQYNDLVPAKTVYWTDEGAGRVSPNSSTTDHLGKAFTTYTAGNVQADIKIVATVPSGLV